LLRITDSIAPFLQLQQNDGITDSIDIFRQLQQTLSNGFYPATQLCKVLNFPLHAVWGAAELAGCFALQTALRTSVNFSKQHCALPPIAADAVERVLACNSTLQSTQFSFAWCRGAAELAGCFALQTALPHSSNCSKLTALQTALISSANCSRCCRTGSSLQLNSAKYSISLCMLFGALLNWQFARHYKWP